MRFLFLQGPHGPFFGDLARALKAAGASVLKVGVSRPDDREWGRSGPFQAFTGAPEAWADWLTELIEERAVTDIVLYGDTRFYHAEAIRVARDAGLTIHCFEEGYLRPFWVTYERGGANGNSKLMTLDAPAMAEASRIDDYDVASAPPIWGAAWRHAYHGFRHHLDLLASDKAYPHYRPHRTVKLWRELTLYLKRLIVLPLLFPQRRWRERRLLKSGKLYHLVMLQMAVDASMREHSRFTSVAEFVTRCLEAFAAGAPRDHHIVFKAHPFEDGRERLEAHAKRVARDLGVANRMVFLQGGKLGPLLDRARSAITVNSTAGQQALWRGLPLSVHGAAVYAKPEFVEPQPLEAFFRRPSPPDAVVYREYRQFLLMSSQLRGGYYSAAGRRRVTEAAVVKMLDPLDPYDRVIADAAAHAIETAPTSMDGDKIAIFPIDAVKS
ncbi:MAG: capsule biosynthesis protein CapA [Pseudomonadota bacterium]